MEPSTNSFPYPGAPTSGYNDNQSPTISVGDWAITILVSFVPFIGIIMLFVWAFSSNTPPSKANWAKATLIFFLVLAVLAVIGAWFAGKLFVTLIDGVDYR